MGFEMWNIWHFLYILSPFIILGTLHFLLKDKSNKTKYIVGVVIGTISLAIITMRNVDIIARNGFDPQAIPLQVCHFGNIIVFLALVFKNKTLTALAFCLNMPFAFASLIEAEVLAGYDSLWQIRPQAYLWGHLFIVVGAAYPVLVNLIRFKLKHVLYSLALVTGIFIIAMLMNLMLVGLGWDINYFYAFNSDGVPFGMFENLAPKLNIMFRNAINIFVSWDYVYSLCVIGIGIFTYSIMYPFSRLIYKFGKGQDVGDGTNAVKK